MPHTGTDSSADAMIAVINNSTRLTDAAALQGMVAAINQQLAAHLCPAWGVLLQFAVVADGVKPVPGSAWQIIILDDADQASELGYHSETPQGQPYGRVFVSPVLDNGGTLTTGPLSVSAVLSHECCEAVCDSPINAWRQAADGSLWALEVADWVEGDSYDIDGVAVSNFVLPAGFDPNAPGPYDYMGLLSAPFTIRPGGYAVLMDGGNLRQQFGDAYPKFKLATKEHPASRTFRRLHR